MPRGAGAAARRRQQRLHQIDSRQAEALYCTLWNLSQTSASSLPNRPGVLDFSWVINQTAADCIRFHLGAWPEFGPFGSRQRENTIDNVISAFLTELFPWVAGVQVQPDFSSKADPSCVLLIFFSHTEDGLGACQAVYKVRNVFIRVLESGLVTSSFSPREFFSSLLLPTRRGLYSAYRPRPLPAATEQQLAASQVVILFPQYAPGLPDPATVTVKIRGLHHDLQRLGTTSAFLQASGYAVESFSVQLEYHAPLTIRGQQPPQPATGLQDFSAMFAIVHPPPHDTMLQRASRAWLLPGHMHKVRVSIIPSHARPVEGVPLYPPRPPMTSRPQQPLGSGDLDQHAEQQPWPPAEQQAHAMGRTARRLASKPSKAHARSDAPSASRQVEHDGDDELYLAGLSDMSRLALLQAWAQQPMDAGEEEELDIHDACQHLALEDF